MGSCIDATLNFPFHEPNLLLYQKAARFMCFKCVTLSLFNKIIIRKFIWILPKNVCNVYHIYMQSEQKMNA